MIQATAQAIHRLRRPSAAGFRPAGRGRAGRHESAPERPPRSRSSSLTTPTAGRSISTFAAPNATSLHACRTRPRIRDARRCDMRRTGAARPRPAQTRRRRPRGDAVAAALGMARRATRRRVGGAAKARRGGAPRQRRSRSQPRREGCGLSLHVSDGRQSAGLRGSLAGVVRGRPTALWRSDRRLARRYPRPHRQARLQRSRRPSEGVTARQSVL